MTDEIEGLGNPDDDDRDVLELMRAALTSALRRVTAIERRLAGDDGDSEMRQP